MIVRVERGWQSPRTQIAEVDVDGLDVDVFCSLSTMWDNLWFFPQLWSNIGDTYGDLLPPILMTSVYFQYCFDLDHSGVGDPKEWTISKFVSCLTM